MKREIFINGGRAVKKYYLSLENENSGKEVLKNAEEQQVAIYASGYKKDKEMKK